MAFYQRIRDLREDADKTQTEIAAYLGTTASIMANMKKGERELPFSRAVLLANFLRCQSGLSRRTHQSPEKVLTGSPLQTMPCWCCKNYTALTERNKGRLEQFLDTLSEQQAQQKRKHVVRVK